MRDPIYDVINSCSSSFFMWKFQCIAYELYDQIIIENQKRKRNGYQTILHEFPSKDNFKMEFTV